MNNLQRKAFHRLIFLCVLTLLYFSFSFTHAHAEEWKSIQGEGEEPCNVSDGTSLGESRYGTLGNTVGACEPADKYRPATYTGTLQCDDAYPAKNGNQAAFKHGTTQKCYSCPNGYDRSLSGITAGDACTNVIPATTIKAAAKFLSKTTISKPHSKAFKDPRNGGEWWRCPDKYSRTLEKVNGSKACVKGVWPDEKLRAASFLSKVNISKPSNNAFKDPRKGGEWWECPKGYNRTASAVTAKDACIKNVPKKIEKAKAVYRGKVAKECALGSFLQVTTGSCYTCGALHIAHPKFWKDHRDLSKEPEACILKEAAEQLQF